MIAEGRTIHVADRRDSPEYRDRLPGAVALVELGGARTHLAVPMLKEGRVVGGIAIYRPEVRPFTQKQVDLVEEARIFNGDDGLARESADEIDLFLRERAHLRTVNGDAADYAFFLEHGH